MEAQKEITNVPINDDNRADNVLFSKLTLIALGVGSLLFLAYLSRQEVFFEANSTVSYYIGIAGGIAMLALFVYPLRKHFSILSVLGPIRFWFRLHMICGITGPLLILFHATFRAGATNSQVALVSMLIVMASGLVGRVIYTRIHRGLYGQKTTLRELESELANEQKIIDRFSQKSPEISRYLAEFSTFTKAGKNTSLVKLGLGIRSRRIKRLCFRLLDNDTSSHQHEIDNAKLLLSRYLAVAVRTNQFSLYEKMFRQWHILHVPFVFLLLLSSVVHIFAVHMY